MIAFIEMQRDPVFENWIASSNVILDCFLVRDAMTSHPNNHSIINSEALNF